MRITLLGPGRLGRTLALLLPRAGHVVRLVGRDGPVPSADVTLLTVPDDHIAEAARRVPRGAGPVLHCSGACAVDVLRPHRPAGSLHPLMTFPGPEVALPDLSGVPAAVAGDQEAVQAAEQVALALGMVPLPVPGDRRLYHAAAVMAGNFATVLLADAARVLQAAGVPEERSAQALLPLALASLRNAAPDPQAALTGPAVRGDQATLRAHRQALADGGLTAAGEVYALMTSRALALAGRSEPPPPRGPVRVEDGDEGG